MSLATLEPRGSAVLDTYIVDCAWSPDGASVVVAGGEGGVIRLDDAASKPRVRGLGEHAMGTLAVAWSPGRKQIAPSGQDGVVVLWDAADGADAKRIRPAAAWTEHLAYSPDGSMLAAAAGRVLSLWARDGSKLHEFEQHGGAIAALAWDKPGRDLAA